MIKQNKRQHRADENGDVIETTQPYILSNSYIKEMWL